MSKAISQASFFTKEHDLGLFNPLKDMKDDEIFDEEEIVAAEEYADKEKANMAIVQVALSLYFFFTRFLPKQLCNSNNDSSLYNEFALFAVETYIVLYVLAFCLYDSLLLMVVRISFLDESRILAAKEARLTQAVLCEKKNLMT